MAIQVRRGYKADFVPEKMLPGEWAVSTDTETANQIVWMCFRPGVVKRMGTYDDFYAQIAEATEDIREEYADSFDEIKAYMEELKSSAEEYKNTAVQKAAESAQSAESAEDSKNEAVLSAGSAEDFSGMSKSYAVGTKGEVRPGDATDNSKYYSDLAQSLTNEATKLLDQAQKLISAAAAGALIPSGTVAFENLPMEPKVGYMYNISNAFVTDSRFAEGAGIRYNPGANVYWTADGQWDVMVGVQVTGVKGAAETLYRQGNVNLTPTDIGLGNVPNVTTNNQSPTFLQSATRENIASGNKLSVIFGKIMKWFADLKAVAFSGSYEDLSNKPEIPEAVAVKGNAETVYRTGEVNLTPANIGLDKVNNTADLSKVVLGVKTQAASDDVNRRVYFANTSSSDTTATFVYDDDFKYNPSTNVLTVGSITGSSAKWTTARNINGMFVDGYANRVNYGTCSTTAATAAKTVACTGFALITGAEITVKFTVTNTAANPTLNVNGTGAKPIYYRGAAISAGYLAANRTYAFRYNGTQWEMVGDINTNTTYSAMTGATASAAGKVGLVPAPMAGTQNKYLTGGGSYQNVDDHTAVFTSSDVADGAAAEWTTVAKLASGETHKSILGKISSMFKNIRYLYKTVTELKGNMPLIELGQSGDFPVEPNSWRDYSVTFKKAFSSTPLIFVSLYAESNSKDYGYIGVTHCKVSKTGCTIRVYATDIEYTRTPQIRWLAIGS